MLSCVDSVVRKALPLSSSCSTSSRELTYQTMMGHRREVISGMQLNRRASLAGWVRPIKVRDLGVGIGRRPRANQARREQLLHHSRRRLALPAPRAGAAHLVGARRVPLVRRELGLAVTRRAAGHVLGEGEHGRLQARRVQQAGVVWIQCAPEVMMARLTASPGDRPALQGQGTVADEAVAVAAARAEAYAAAADCIVDGDAPIATVVQDIMQWWSAASSDATQ